MSADAFACPCCGYPTLSERPPGTYAICPVCSWEDDPVQFRDASFRGGANSVSLDEARANFEATGTSDPASRLQGRRPTAAEERDRVQQVRPGRN